MSNTAHPDVLQKRAAIERDLAKAFDAGEVHLGEMAAERGRRYRAAGVPYTPEEIPALTREVEARIRAAALSARLTEVTVNEASIARMVEKEVRQLVG